MTTGTMGDLLFTPPGHWFLSSLSAETKMSYPLKHQLAPNVVLVCLCMSNHIKSKCLHTFKNCEWGGKAEKKLSVWIQSTLCLKNNHFKASYVLWKYLGKIVFF